MIRADNNAAGQFNSWRDPSIPVMGGAGRYVAVTNLADLSPTTELTIAVWAYYGPSKDTNGNLVSWTADSGAAILSAGYAHTNSWELARNGTRPPLFRIHTNNTASGFVNWRFKDTFNTYGESDAWHHYAVTFNKGVITLFQDGLPYATNSIVYQPTIGVAGGWIGIGCKTHGASVWSTPRFGDDIPTTAG